MTPRTATETGEFPVLLPRRRSPQYGLEVVVALSLAFLVWLYIRTRDHESLDHVSIPVQVNVAPAQESQYFLEITTPPHVVVSFIGPPSRIRELREMLQRGEVRVSLAVSVPEDRLNEGRYRETLRVGAADVPAPPGVTVMVVEGANRIPVTLHRLVERRLAVHVNHAADDRISQVVVQPARVLVRGPQDVLERAHSILTRPYRLPFSTDIAPGEEKVLTMDLPLAREMEGKPVQAAPGTVRVRLTLRPRPQVYQLKDVPIRFLCPASFPYRVQFLNDRTGKITLRVKAPASVHPPAVVAYVDLTGSDVKPGLNVEPVRLQLPGDCTLAQDQPGPVGFALVSTEISSPGLLGVGPK